MALFGLHSPKQVHVLLYEGGTDNEGIHSIDKDGRTIILMFENSDAAECYAARLENSDFPVPTVTAIDRKDVEVFCRKAGYEARLIESDFVPSNDEERLFVEPPQGDVEGLPFGLYLINDDVNTMEYIVEKLQQVCSLAHHEALYLTLLVHNEGKALVFVARTEDEALEVQTKLKEGRLKCEIKKAEG